VLGSWLTYPTDAWATEERLKPYPYDPTQAKALLAGAGYPRGFEVTMNLTAWPGRGYLPDVGEWPLIPGHMGFHNWEYVTHTR